MYTKLSTAIALRHIEKTAGWFGKTVAKQGRKVLKNVDAKDVKKVVKKTNNSSTGALDKIQEASGKIKDTAENAKSTADSIRSAVGSGSDSGASATEKAIAAVSSAASPTKLLEEHTNGNLGAYGVGAGGAGLLGLAAMLARKTRPAPKRFF
jgi:uncharacterized phage infection (PIP) family protein YhgE